MIDVRFSFFKREGLEKRCVRLCYAFHRLTGFRLENGHHPVFDQSEKETEWRKDQSADHFRQTQ